MKFTPQDDRILIKPSPPDRERGGLLMQGSDVTDKAEGTVVAVGPGIPLHNIHLNVTGEVTEKAMDSLKQVIELLERGQKIPYVPGDYVLYGKYSGTKITLDGEEHLIVRRADVFGQLEEDTEVDGAPV